MAQLEAGKYVFEASLCTNVKQAVETAFLKVLRLQNVNTINETKAKHVFGRYWFYNKLKAIITQLIQKQSDLFILVNNKEEISGIH